MSHYQQEQERWAKIKSNMRTQLVAEAIELWIRKKEHGEVGTSLFVRENETGPGHLVSWEEGFEDWTVWIKGILKDQVEFMGVWLDDVNHNTIGVYELDPTARWNETLRKGEIPRVVG